MLYTRYKVADISKLGRVVYTTKTDATLETIDVSSFNKGTYILKMSNTNHALTKSIIIN